METYWNAYYCYSDFKRQGTCCYFPTESTGIENTLDPKCLDSPQLSQRCSH